RAAADGGSAQPSAPSAWGAPQPAAPGGWQPPSPAAGGWPAQPAAPTGYAPDYGPGAAGPQGAAGLFTESALPDWLREASAGQPPLAAPHLGAPGPFMNGLAPSAAPGPATPYPARPYGAAASPSQYPGSGQAGGNLAANALFDAGALPTWLGGAGNNGQPARPAATPLGGDGLQMSTLVDERALPMWLRQEPETPPTQTPQPGSVSRWLSAPVTEEPMPSFLNQVYDAAQVSRTAIPPNPPSYWSAAGSAATPPMPGAVPSANLVDDSALPQWLRAQVDGQPGYQAPAYQPPTYQAPGGFGAAPGDAQAGWGGPAPATDPAPFGPANSFAASDLIEPGAVPAWVQHGAPPAQQEFSSTAGWTDHLPAQPPSSAAGGQRGMAMNPGWDESALRPPAASAPASASLPAWLQSPNAPADPAPSGRWPAPTGRHRARESMIPPTELPPWLQNGAEPAAAARPAPPPPEPPATDQEWDELQRGWGDGESGHYLDRFGAEEPGVGQPFGLEYDQQRRAAEGAPANHDGQRRDGAMEGGKGKRKRRGR
ncbi:MAG TPA: hypothetical protein VGR57_09180, partial [Ktedonobacterales bacterium]|nr:hypothetical protein [Ktedonobacterales bacterium]